MSSQTRLLAVCFSLGFMLAAQGCSEDPAPAQGFTPNSPITTPGPIDGAGNGPGVVTPGPVNGPVNGPITTPGPMTPGVDMGPGPVGPTPGVGDTFCQVKDMVRNNCHNCHGAEKAFGAPMSLVTHADLIANSPVDGRPNYMVMLDRVQDMARPMPPTPNPMLNAEQVGVLQAWVDAGTPDSTTCGATTDPGPVTNDPSCIDCGSYTCDPSKGKPVQILAHGQPTAGDTSPYDASSIGLDGSPDLYQCFYFKAPWADGEQGLGYKPVIDNKRVLHHWLLYASDQAPQGLADGGMTGRCQAQGDPNRVLLAGWAPGTPGINLPDGVGQQLPSGSRAYVTLEIHYYNTEPGQPAMDRSGVEICVANEPQANVATQHWLGTEKISVPAGGMKVAGDTCTPRLTAGQTSTIISVTPHMHKIGAHSKLEVIRQGGQVETILDKAFQFDNQTTYMLDTPFVINAGDQLRATCTYMNTTSGTVGYGEGSDEEMCYLFTTAYPAGSLHNGKNGCALGLCIPGGITRCIDNENILDAAGAL